MRTRLLAALLLAPAALPAEAAARDMGAIRDRAVRWAVAHAGLHERDFRVMEDEMPDVAARIRSVMEERRPRAGDDS